MSARCVACGSEDLTPTGRCRACRAELRALLVARVAALGPCTVCGASDRSPRGGCRPCARKRKAAQRARERDAETVERKRLLVDVLETAIANPELAARLSRK